MKYQITCDNCGSKFIVEAEEGSTIECKCPSCSGIMDIVLPMVNKGKEYIPHQEDTSVAIEDRNSQSSKWLWILVVVLVLIAISAVAYFSLQPSVAEQPVSPQTTIMDTIPYEQPQLEEPKPVVPDVEEAEPEVEPEEEIVPEEVQPEIPTDSTQTENLPAQE